MYLDESVLCLGVLIMLGLYFSLVVVGLALLATTSQLHRQQRDQHGKAAQFKRSERDVAALKDRIGQAESGESDAQTALFNAISNLNKAREAFSAQPTYMPVLLLSTCYRHVLEGHDYLDRARQVD